MPRCQMYMWPTGCILIRSDPRASWCVPMSVCITLGCGWIQPVVFDISSIDACLGPVGLVPGNHVATYPARMQQWLLRAAPVGICLLWLGDWAGPHQRTVAWLMRSMRSLGIR